MGVGKRRIEGMYLSTVVAHREVSANDGGDIDDIVESIDLRLTEDGQPVPAGYNAYLVLFVLLRDGITAADIELFASGELGQLGPEGSESSIPGGASEFCKVGATEALTGSVNRALIFDNLPAGEYKVRVSAIAGAGTVIIREAHSG